IIMLTAKSSITDQINGIKCGADAYICKPFNSEELQVRVEKLLEIRKLLKEKYLRIVFKGEKNSMSNDINSDFLQQVTNIIYRDMKNAEFSSKKLADEMAISISQLNKKLNALTGFPASTYILQVKLELAKKILSTYDRSIGEVA
ncbi:MAG TPA: hybrid sensor histidine kinase/response regulator, partial [Porphyromonadaceae bacterium]|nr:hybrid sensor histidine kinase/response regulator [Porphyromonadaceae bacterium]